MMSLFSTFDLNLFKLIFMFNMILWWNTLNKIFTLTFKSNFNDIIVENMAKFFYTLKYKSIHKFSMSLMTTIFMTLLSINMMSIFSYNFTMTSQLSLVLFISLVLWTSMFMFTLAKSMKMMLAHWIPQGTPMVLVPFLFMVEMISNLIRPLTISIRLTANILAGHLLMILLSQLVLSKLYLIWMYLLLNLVEMAVAAIQAYIFSTMMTLYYSET